MSGNAQAGLGGNGLTEPHAVRWARRERRRTASLDYTRWHWTTDASFTACGCPIPIGLAGTFLPETDDEDRVNCKRCLQKMKSMQSTNNRISEEGK
jgi:hypothetical protein